LNYLNDLTLGRYHPGESVLHRLDPRTKLLCTLVWMLVIFRIERVPGILVFLLLTVLLFPLAHLPLQIFWRNVRAFFWLYGITFLIHLFFHPGQVIWVVPGVGWNITAEGIQAGILFTVRIAILISISNLLMAVTTPQDITDGLEKMFRPLVRFGIPVGESALMISIALRFVPILWEESDKIRKAQISRGADLEGSWILRIRKTIPMILPLFAGALKRADDLAMALEARAYRGGRGRTQMISLQMSLRDYLAFTTTAGIMIAFWMYGNLPR
jgi:energy-coupling factor transport system permease protein